MLEGFDVSNLKQAPILSHYRVLGRVGTGANVAMMKMGDSLRDALSFNLSCILQKTAPRESARPGDHPLASTVSEDRR